jgi:hypothetical protein
LDYHFCKTYNFDLGLTGSFVGVQDSIQRISGILAPLFVSKFPSFWNGIYVGACISGIFYLVALLFVNQLQTSIKEKAS